MAVEQNKITIRWLIDHVPVRMWIALIAYSITIFGAGISISKTEYVVNWFQDLAPSKDEKELSKQIERNNELTDRLDSLKTELTNERNTNRELEKKLNEATESIAKIEAERQTVMNRIEEAEARNESLTNENHLLRVEIDALKEQLKKSQQAREQESIKVATTEQGENKVTEVRAASRVTFEQLRSAVRSMYSSHVAGFLIEMVPKIKGGIACEDLAELVGRGWLSSGSSVAKKVAPYVKRPLSAECPRRLSSVMYSSEASEAIRVLLNSEPKY